ncbi:MAG: hypothetical protein D6701_10195 [Gemmatimonadetes bacterium]|nr:MAG: hypothetical protein D6701_10195 [Gemmatimonadota bacterium]
MRSNAAAPAAIVLLVLAGLLVGLGSILQPAVTLPLTLEVGVLGGLSVALLRREQDPATRRWLTRLLVVALVLRIGLALVLHLGLTPYFFAPDAFTYEFYGNQLAEYWRGLAPFPEFLKGRTEIGYYVLNGVFDFLFSESGLALGILNSFAGAATAVMTFYLGRILLGEAAGKAAAVLVAVYPSLVLWSVLNIRDALTTTVVTFCVLTAARGLRGMRPGAVAQILVALGVLATLRDYLALLLAGGLLLGWLLSVRRGRILPTLVMGTAVVVGVAFGAEQFGLLRRVPVEDPLESVENIRRDFQRGGSGYGQEYSTATPEEALRYLPVGVAFFLFGPFPWDQGSALQTATMPEVLLWYLLFPLFLIGVRLALTRGDRASLLVVAVLISILVPYALVESNFGTAYRHRAQILPLFFLFTAVGIRRLWTNWRQTSRSHRSRLRAGGQPSAVR